MCEQDRARWRRPSRLHHSSDGSVSVTLVVEFDSLVPQEDSLWQFCPVATEELILCLRVDRSVRTPNHAPIWLFHLCLTVVMFIPRDRAELTREKIVEGTLTGCPSRGCGFRCTQVRHLCKDEVME